MILALTCCAGTAAPTSNQPFVPCSKLLKPYRTPAGVAAMSDREARTTLANDDVIASVCRF